MKIVHSTSYIEVIPFPTITYNHSMLSNQLPYILNYRRLYDYLRPGGQPAPHVVPSVWGSETAARRLPEKHLWTSWRVSRATRA